MTCPTIVCCPRLVSDVNEATSRAGIDACVLAVPLQCEGPMMLWDAFADRLRAARALDSPLIVLGGSCVEGTLPPPPELGVRQLSGTDRCFDLVFDSSSVDELIRGGAYLVTPGWLNGWRAHLDSWGFSEAGLRDFLAESVDRIVLLDTGTSPGSAKALEEMGVYAGLPVQRIPVGLDMLSLRLDGAVREVRAAAELSRPRSPAAADYAMALDLLGQVGGLKSTHEVVVAVLELCEVLFRPGWARWSPEPRGDQGSAQTTMVWRADASELPEVEVGPTLADDAPHRVTEDGFLLRIMFGTRVLGVLAVGDVALRERRVDYANLARGLAPAVGMALANAEFIERIRDAERSLSAEKEQLAVTLRSIGDGVVVADTDGRVRLMNKVAEELSGWTEADAVGQPLETVLRMLRSEDRLPVESPVARVLRSGAGAGTPGGTILIDGSGVERLITDSGAPVVTEGGEVQGVVLVFRDVTAQETLEREVRRVERLSSLGMLAAGIAHDFNNLLAVAAGNVSVVSTEARPGSTTREALDEAASALMGASKLTRQLMAFSTGASPVREVSSLEQLVRETASFVGRGSDVAISIDIESALWNLEMDSGQINQVVHNLLINAIEAMQSGGTVALTAINETLGRETPVPLPPGPYVCLCVADTGPGIPPDQIDRIFDPFFSTKNRGTGLGLSSSYTIARNHGGHLSVRSSLGEGTTMCLRLPALPGAEPNPKEEPPDDAIHPAPVRVLAMDDDPSIRRLIQRILSRHGHEVVAVPDGRAAVDAFSRAVAERRPFGLVILDRTVPGAMGGVETLAAIRQLDPGVRAVLATGYAADGSLMQYRELGFAASLSKPFDVASLTGLVARLLTHDATAS